MVKCLKIMFDANFPTGFLHNFIQKNAQKLNLEGSVQIMPVEKKVRIIICGLKEHVEDFLDLLHKGNGKYVPHSIEVEPFLKDKDYRGVFRVIE